MGTMLANSTLPGKKPIISPSLTRAKERLPIIEKLRTGERLHNIYHGAQTRLPKFHPELAPLMLRVHQVFGKRPRDFQEHAVDSLLRKRDLIVKAAPGAGKSLIFLAMCLLRPGAIVLAVTPLLAIMNDQVSHANRVHINGDRCQSWKA